jgi:hypothetical protein
MRFAERLAGRVEPAVLRACAAGLVALIVTAIFARGRATPWIDALPRAGRYWVIEAPLPALVLLPWVALFGDANQTLLAVILCAVTVGACWLACERLGVAPRIVAWICVFLFAGTQLAWCAMLGDVWFIAHVAAVACTFVALAELVGKRRSWIVALGAVAAVFSRFALVLAIPVYAWLVLRERDPRERRRAAIGFCGVVACGAAIWVWYNLARWGVWYDVGYTDWYHQDTAGSPVGSPFQLRYFAYELQSFFVQGPQFGAVWPYVVPTYNGVAMTWTSPALVLAVFARRPRALVAGMWAATLLVAGPSFLYYVNGYAQFGMRHALDFEPFVIVLMALAFPQRLPAIGKVLIAWSAVVGLWGIWFWNTFYRH